MAWVTPSKIPNVKLRHKLALTFGVLAVFVQMTFGLIVYYFESQHRKNEFFDRLKSRVDITEKMVLEKDSFSPEALEKIREQFLNKLPEETEEVIPLPYKWQEKLVVHWPESFLRELAEKDEAYFEDNSRQGAGRIFHLKGGSYAVIITAVDQSGLELLQNLKRLLIITLIASVLITFSVSYIIARYILKPVVTTIQEANTISANNLNYRLQVVNSDDELGQLALAFNQMLERIEQTFQSQKRFVADASHEIRNPLTSILGEAELALQKERKPDEYRAALQQIYHEADRMNKLVNNLLQLSAIMATPIDLKKEVVSLTELLHEAISIYSRKNASFKAKVNVHDNSIFVRVNRNLMVHAIMNLLDNASKFSGQEEIQITAGKAEGYAFINITDKGVGIPEEDIPRIRQPFFRSENVREVPGTGIGIPLTVRIIEMHGGSFSVQSRLNEGTTVIVNMPLVG